MLDEFFDKQLKEIIINIIDTLYYGDICQLVESMVYYVQYGETNHIQVSEDIKPVYELFCYIVDIKKKLTKKKVKEDEKKQ